MMERNPFEKGKSLLLKLNNKRLRYLKEEEIQKLLDKSPKHLRRIIECALNTGMRRGEILNLKWSQVKDGFIYLEGQMTKTKEPREVPINEDLSQIFKEIRKEQQLRSGYVFTYQPNENKRKTPRPKSKLSVVGKTINRVDTSFNSAVEHAGIKDFKFHDLRHTFASHMVMRGANIKEFQEILGHKTMAMTLRYAHLSQEHKKKAVNLLNGLTSNSDCHKSVTLSETAL